MANPIRAFLDRPNDDRAKTFGIAFAVAFVCALTVTITATALKPIRQAQITAEREARMAAMLDALPGLRALLVEAGVDGLETRIVALDDGSYADIDPAGYDPLAAAENPETSIGIPQEADIAGLRRRENHAPVYILERDGKVAIVVLPVRGQGYQAQIRAMLALEADLTTVAALTILEQADTPGLGARIEEPEWQAQWVGKQIAGPDGTIMIEVVRGGAATPYQVDGISGATYTSSGVGNMVKFWLGPLGYGPFLDRLRAEGL